MNARDLAAGVALAIGVVGAVSAWLDRPGTVDVPRGRSDPGVYEVQPVGDAAPITVAHGGALLPVARFETRGRVLNIERFKPYQSLVNWIPGLRPATHDIGLGYGPMSDTINVERFDFAHEGVSHGLRALFARPREAMSPQDFESLAPHITNVHVIPATDAVYSQLRRVKTGELVTLRGLLVDVRDADGRVATTSTRAGDRDCEILWLQEVRIDRL
jgi:hypothetical protein